ncbi:multiple organellar RNA editing factor 5, chloroplastic/mitochondrial-like [Lycium barbarum]|uniref:multiple organellar RNA editing factor 5, chloroplastic/mitochondrial-like n=1 Tax=Lycium barbarum TaxID=112863 RepID=UPI00293E8658|nr:multiple organellar RNA editing factor 5, chloroplastic/mitochondrial-like [Lycium barbarum]
MASKITKSISRTLYTSRYSYRLLSSTSSSSSSSSPSITQQPSLPTVRSSFLLSHSLLPTNPNFLKPFSLNSVRFRVNRSGNSPYTPGTGDRAPTEMAPLFPGCDYEHWLIVMDKPGGEGAHKQQMIECYVQTLAKVLGSAPTEMATLFLGCDYEHWLIVMDKPINLVVKVLINSK